MKFCWTTIRVKDLDESIKFYKEVANLELDKRFAAGPGVEIAFLGSGETKLELIHTPDVKTPEFGKDISVGLEVESVDKAIENAKNKGVAVESGPFSPNPHVKFFYVLDPNGLRVQLVENI